MSKRFKHWPDLRNSHWPTPKEQFSETRYIGATLAKLVVGGQSELLKIANFMKEPKNFLVFCGNPGIGKTYLCASFY